MTGLQGLTAKLSILALLVGKEGRDGIARSHASLAGLFASTARSLSAPRFINGLPGFVTREADGELQTTALEIEDGKVAAIYVMRNPDKLRHLH